MINNRPETLLASPYYTGVPAGGFGVDMSAIPDLVRASLLTLGGVQPITGAIAGAAGGKLQDKPSDGEIAYHRQVGSVFQLIMVVMNLAALREQDGELLGTPYSVSLMPASKRGKVDTATIDFVAQMDPDNFMGGQACYLGYDPFQGEWGLFGNLDMFRATERDSWTRSALSSTTTISRQPTTRPTCYVSASRSVHRKHKPSSISIATSDSFALSNASLPDKFGVLSFDRTLPAAGSLAAGFVALAADDSLRRRIDLRRALSPLA